MNVEFYAGATKLGEETQGTYEFTWPNAPAGAQVVYAKAYDDEGATSFTVTYTDSDPAWTPDLGWDYGAPAGNDGDPSSGATSAAVVGNNLTERYDLNLNPVYAMTTPINCSSADTVSTRIFTTEHAASCSHRTDHHPPFRIEK